MPRGIGDPIPVLAAADTARQANLAPGRELVLVPRRASGLPPIAIVIAGIAEPSDPASSYWSGRPGLLERSASGAFALFVPETTFFGAMARPADPRQRRLRGDLHGQPGRRPDGRCRGHRRARARTAEAARRPRRRPGGERSPAGDRGRGRPAGLRHPGARTALRADRGRGRLLVFGGASLLAARRASLRASLRLAGASRTQIAALEILATLPAALLGLVAGAPLAALTAAVLGRLEGFEALGGGFAMTAQRDLPWLRRERSRSS